MGVFVDSLCFLHDGVAPILTPRNVGSDLDDSIHAVLAIRSNGLSNALPRGSYDGGGSADGELRSPGVLSRSDGFLLSDLSSALLLV